MKALLLSVLLAGAITPGFAQGTAKPAPAAPPAKATPATAPAKAAPAKAAPAPAATGFVGNKDSKICHKADCKSVAKMKEANKTTFASAAEAQKAGYKACKSCKPF